MEQVSAQALRIDLYHSAKFSVDSESMPHQYAVVLLRGDVVDGVYSQVGRRLFATYEGAVSAIRTLRIENPGSVVYEFSDECEGAFISSWDMD